MSGEWTRFDTKCDLYGLAQKDGRKAFHFPDGKPMHRGQSVLHKGNRETIAGWDFGHELVMLSDGSMVPYEALVACDS